MTAEQPLTPMRVWAPQAQRVELLLDGQRTPMISERGGWWRADAQVDSGDDYAFSLDGGEPLPDPRSPWQPDGPFGPSRLVDHARFTWSDQRWQAPPLASAVIYELHIGTFTPDGTFDAAIAQLDHLVALGVT
ncbi:MAG TPA: hypothetical protein VHI51_00005, partial [Ktedonobacterales bacterium]|nr:hypothetical protein [Ktedonobacterales bacterium]